MQTLVAFSSFLATKVLLPSVPCKLHKIVLALQLACYSSDCFLTYGHKLAERVLYCRAYLAAEGAEVVLVLKAPLACDAGVVGLRGARLDALVQKDHAGAVDNVRLESRRKQPGTSTSEGEQKRG